MPLFLKESIFFKIIFCFFNVFIKAYNNSGFKKNINKISFVVHQSSIVKIFSGYNHKPPAFLNSVTYKVTLCIVHGIDKAADAIHNLFAIIINKSNTAKQFKTIKYNDVSEKLEVVSAFVIMMAIGFLTGKVILSDATIVNIIIAWIIFFVGCLIAYGEKVVTALKNSLCWSIIKKF